METSKIEDGVRVFSLEAWAEFAKLVTDEFVCAPAYVYRGQADYEWPIVSALHRLEEKYPKRKNLGGTIPEDFDVPSLSDEEHLAAFKRAIRGRRGPNPRELTDDEYWGLGQHHGLATPLLDWARSPYVALFFAFEEEIRPDAENRLTEPPYRSIYALSTSTIGEHGRPSDDVSMTAGDNAVKLVSSVADENYRLINQGGLLLKMPRHDLESYVRDRFKGESHQAIFAKVKIPNKGRHDCLASLNKMNINRMSLFPDIDGAAKYVNSLWQPGHEDSIAYV